MIKFTYANGREVEYDYDWNKLAPKLQLGWLRLFSPQPGTLIPLNSQTIALIEDTTIYEEVPEEHEETVEKLIEEEKVEEIQEDEEKPLSVEEKKEKILAEMAEKQACTHENRSIHYQEIMSGPRNNRQVQKRYFPVCDFCGVRERYVAASKLSEDEIANAIKWDK